MRVALLPMGTCGTKALQIAAMLATACSVGPRGSTHLPSDWHPNGSSGPPGWGSSTVRWHDPAGGWIEVTVATASSAPRVQRFGADGSAVWTWTMQDAGKVDADTGVDGTAGAFFGPSEDAGSDQAAVVAGPHTVLVVFHGRYEPGADAFALDARDGSLRWSLPIRVFSAFPRSRYQNHVAVGTVGDQFIVRGEESLGCYQYAIDSDRVALRQPSPRESRAR